MGRGLSQQALADRLGLGQRQISDLERGVVDPRFSTIQNVARALDLELMLIPRPLLVAVHALQQAGGDEGTRPLYTLDEEEEDDRASAPPPVEVGDTRARPRRATAASPSRRGSRT